MGLVIVLGGLITSPLFLAVAFPDNIPIVEKAAWMGARSAQYDLGQHYFDGDVVPKDLKKAEFWFEQAALRGDVDAQFNLAAIHYNKRVNVAYHSKKAFYWYKQAALQGDVEAQYMLASLYHRGWGVAESSKNACMWFEKAAQQGHTTSQHSTGYCYYNGILGPPSAQQRYKMAFDFFSKAAQKNFIESDYALGTLYFEGKGVPKDWNKAYYWFTQGAQQGHIPSATLLAFLKKSIVPKQTTDD